MLKRRTFMLTFNFGENDKFHMKYFYLILFFIVAAVAMTGCETEGTGRTASQSAIPWNRPASWEGAGMLGAMGMGSH